LLARVGACWHVGTLAQQNPLPKAFFSQIFQVTTIKYNNMKFQTFNTKNCQSTVGRQTKPFIGINTKNGVFRINKSACELIGLSAKHSITFHHDEENEGDWYIEIVKEDGFELRQQSKDIANVLIFNSSTLARKIAESVAFEKETGTIYLPKTPVKHEKRTLWPLLTASLRN
jgi:hypothetical protein